MVLRGVPGTAVVAGIAASALLLAACGTKKSSTDSAKSGGSPGSTSDFTACMVTDTGGIDDKSFNASAWAGMQRAQSNGKAKVSYVQSKAETDYATNISKLEPNCKLIVTVGGLMGNATAAAAKSKPSQHFAIVDSSGNGNNVQGLQFNTAQSAFLGGYLAAGYSKTGKVATFGGLKIAPVTIYMDGFQEGVQYYNKQKNKAVEVLGWDGQSQNGSFAGAFNKQDKGQTLATNFIGLGADVIFPVAGGTGLGTAAAAQSTGKASVIWVDTDGFTAAPQYGSIFLSSVIKGIDGAVQKAVEDSSAGTPATKDYIGDLSNGGTGLAPYHAFEGKVDASLTSDLVKVKQDIISGAIKINSPSQPKAK